MLVFMELAEAAAMVASFRKANAPAADDPRARLTRCRRCPRSYWRWVDDDRRYCPDCGAARMLEVWETRQTAAHERWLGRMRAELDELEGANLAAPPPTAPR